MAQIYLLLRRAEQACQLAQSLHQQARGDLLMTRRQRVLRSGWRFMAPRVHACVQQLQQAACMEKAQCMPHTNAVVLLEHGAHAQGVDAARITGGAGRGP